MTSLKSRDVIIDSDGFILRTKSLTWLENEVEDLHMRRQICKYLSKWVELLADADACPNRDFGHQAFLALYRQNSVNMWMLLPTQIATRIDNHISACRKHLFC